MATGPKKRITSEDLETTVPSTIGIVTANCEEPTPELL